MDLVFLHAFPLDRRLFDPQRDSFGARLHTPDLPGFGASLAAPAHTVDAMADAVHEYVKGLGLTRFVLGGISMGGYVTLAYARKYGTKSLAGLVLAHTRADADLPEAKANRDAAIGSLAGGSTDALVDKQLPRMFADPVPAWLSDETRALMKAQPVATVAAALEALRDRPDSMPLLPSFDVPALVLAGAGDVVAPPAVMKAMADALPKARYVELPGVGHLGNLQAPGPWNDAVHAFLKTL